MPTVIEALTLGIDHQRAGRLPQAEAVYREILHSDPRNPDALHLLGLLAHQSGKHELALGFIGQAIALRPSIAPFQNSLGIVLHAMERFAEAQAALETSVRLDPDFAEARVNLGNLLQDLGRPVDAAAEYQ